MENSGILFDRYKDLSLMELALSLHNLTEYYEMDFKNFEIWILKTLKLAK